MPTRPAGSPRTAFFALLLVWLLAASPLPPADARPSPASDLTATLLSWSRGQIQVQREDGRMRTVSTTSATWILRRGLPAASRDFAPGETLQIRLGRGTGGAARALLVCDPETAEALAAKRGHLWSGTLLSASGKVWIVQPDDSPLPLPVCLSSHTTFRVGESAVASGAFGAGTHVTIQIRGLPNGLPSAVSVTDGTDVEAIGAKKQTPHRRKTFSGTIVEARLDLGRLTLQDKNGSSQTVTVDGHTSMTVRTRKGRRVGTWDDLIAGRPVFVRFAGTEDSDGNPLAGSLSVSVP